MPVPTRSRARAESTLEEYIRIPNQSPSFEPDWEASGHTAAAVELLCNWVRAQGVEGLALEVLRAPGRTPLIFIELPAWAPPGAAVPTQTVMLYGHLDKQCVPAGAALPHSQHSAPLLCGGGGGGGGGGGAGLPGRAGSRCSHFPPSIPNDRPPMTAAWSAGLAPYTPVVRDGKLYGRGGADDGYALFGSVTALAALRAAGAPHGRAVILIEASEESGSPDLPAYVAQLAPRIGVPTLIVCLDSGCGDYERLWVTTSLRGLVGGTLRVAVLTEAVHSGSSSGVVPSSFRLARQLLSRVEDEASGRVLLPELWCDVPPARSAQAAATAAILGASVYRNFPLVAGAAPLGADDHAALLLRRTWQPALSVTGAAGLPPLEAAGNVLRTSTSLKLSMRLPPRVDAEAASAAFKRALEREPPCGAHVSYTAEKAGPGWDAPAALPWLTAAIEEASRAGWGRAAAYHGEGGSIPFMGMLGEMFQQAQFIVTGVLGPGSNAHGPDEFLEISYVKRVITVRDGGRGVKMQQRAAAARLPCRSRSCPPRQPPFFARARRPLPASSPRTPSRRRSTPPPRRWRARPAQRAARRRPTPTAPPQSASSTTGARRARAAPEAAAPAQQQPAAPRRAPCRTRCRRPRRVERPLPPLPHPSFSDNYATTGAVRAVPGLPVAALRTGLRQFF